MKTLLLAVTLAATSLSARVRAADTNPNGNDSAAPMTIAVFGDWPYDQLLLDNAPLQINSVNADAKVSLVLHVGDIHSGMPCTSAGILPPITTSNPGWNDKIYFQFQQFVKPFVYTPGDNEWTDCHKSKEKSAGAPLNELAAVRSLFFARPGHTLGLTDKTVLSQAQYFDPTNPADAQYVENVMWMDGKVVFVTLNARGSNNDTLPWTGIFANPAAQAQEVATRNAANARWLQSAFDLAAEGHARAVVVGLQADMWDPAQIANGEGLDKYTPFVQQLADEATAFGGPVLLLNGDSHLYEQDYPLADPNSSKRSHPPYPGRAEPHAHHRAGIDQGSCGMAAPDDRHAKAATVQLDERSLLHGSADELPVTAR